MNQKTMPLDTTCDSFERSISHITLAQSFAEKTDNSKWKSKRQYTYILGQMWWILKEAILLIRIMGWGAKWLYMLFKLSVYGCIMLDGFMRSVWWYMNSPTIFRRVNYREDTNCLENNRAYLDIYYPIPIFDMLREQLSLFVNKKSDTEAAIAKKKYPVIISICGGAWIIGSHYWSLFAARVISMCGYVVVCPDYRNFPQATIPLMIDDVSDAIGWTFENIDSFCGDSNRVTAIGQSAGGHLLFCSVARQVEMMQKGCMATYNPADFEHLIGLSGMYDLVTMSEHLHRRGLYTRVLRKIAGPGNSLADVSAPVMLDRVFKRSLSSNPGPPLRELLPRYITFIHGTADCSAPYSEGEKMHKLFYTRFFQDKEGPILTLKILEGQTHTDPIVELPLLGHCDIIEMLSIPQTSDRSTGGSSRTVIPEPNNRVLYCPPIVSRRRVKLAKWICPF